MMAQQRDACLLHSACSMTKNSSVHTAARWRRCCSSRWTVFAALRHNAAMSESAEEPVASVAAPQEQTVEQVLGSVHTSNFPDILRELGGCLFVSTYQAGKLVILRPDGNSITPHFRRFNRPVG